MFNLLIFFLFPLLGAINSQSFPDPLSPEEEEKYDMARKEILPKIIFDISTMS